jgi:hypothetical protein
MDLLRNRTLNSDSSDLKLIPTIKNIQNVDIKNQRPRDYLEERESYEQLCRKNTTRVKEKISNSKINLCLFLNLVKSKTRS